MSDPARRVDVIVPCYNYGRYLRQCVDSVLAQPGVDVRVRVIDDCSTDDSLAVARERARDRPRLSVAAHPQNRGHIATYNEGIAWVTAPYMLLLSADDFLAEGALGRAVDVMQAQPGCGVVFGRAIRFADGDEAAVQQAQTRPAGPVTLQRGAAFVAGICAHPTNPIDTATAVVRSTLQQRFGGYLPELPHSGDLEMWLRLATYGDVGFVDAVQAFTRLHGGNMRTAYMADRMLGDFEQRRLALQMYFEAHGGALEAAERLQQTASRELATQVVWAAAATFEDGAGADVQRLLLLARRIWPDVERGGPWRRLALKRRLGPRLWRRLDAALSALRRTPAAAGR